MQEKYPVMKLSLKSAKQRDFDTAYFCLVNEIAKEYRRHAYVLKLEILTENEKEMYASIMEGEAEYKQYVIALIISRRTLVTLVVSWAVFLEI